MPTQHLTVGVITGLVAYVGLGAGAAWALSCGDEITVDTKLTANIEGCTANGLEIGADGITLNCAGRTISGDASTGSGILLDGRENVTVKNCRVTGFGTGIEMFESSNNKLTKNNIYLNQFDGIELDDFSNNNNISHNKIYENEFSALDINDASNDNYVINNKIYENGLGLDINAADGNVAQLNRITDNGEHGVFVGFTSLNNTISGNYVADNGKTATAPGIEDQGNGVGNAYRYNLVKGNNGVGMLIAGTDVDVRGNLGFRNEDSGLLVVGTGSTVSKNVFNNNGGDGICVVVDNDADGLGNRARRNGGQDLAFDQDVCPTA